MGVVSAWSWECRPPASVQCIGRWGHLCSHRLLGVQSCSCLDQCEDILSLVGIKLGSWIKNSPVSTHDTAEPSPLYLSSGAPPLGLWTSLFCCHWYRGISWAWVLTLLCTLFYWTMSFASSLQKTVLSYYVMCWKIVPSVSYRSFVQLFRFYLF